jgi:hypothetical protein
MIYVAPSHPELVAIDKNTGEIFVVDLNTIPKYTPPISIEGVSSTSPIEPPPSPRTPDGVSSTSPLEPPPPHLLKKSIIDDDDEYNIGD